MSDFRTIPLSRGFVAVVDVEDHEMLSRLTWYAHPSNSAFYARHTFKRAGTRGAVIMHRLLLRAPPGLFVDHINRDTLDNRRCNLRLCSAAENNRRQRPVGRCAKGVSKVADSDRWRAAISADGRYHHLGYFPDEASAARAYDAAAIQLHGAFACLNFPATEAARAPRPIIIESEHGTAPPGP